MPDTQIKDLTPGTPVQSTDRIPVARGAGNAWVPASDFASAAQGAKADTAAQIAGDLGGTAAAPTVPGLAGKQATLVSGSNIKSINGTSLLGSGDLVISGGGTTVENVLTSISTTNALSAAQGKALKDTADSLAATVAGKADTSVLTTGLAGKADAAATTTALAGKANTAHTHVVADVTDYASATTAAIAAAPVNTATSTALGLKADLASPTFTGTPAVPTAAPGTNTTQVASTAYVRSEVAALVNSAPTALDTLAELATALGGDANFSATVTTALGTKLTQAQVDARVAALTDAVPTNGSTNSVSSDGVFDALALKANTASLAPVATAGTYASLTGLPTLGTAAAQPSTAFATAAEGALAGTALQPGAQLTQAAVTGATAPGVALLGAANVAAQRTALGLGAAALVGVDATPTNGSANAVSSDGAFDALAAKQDTLVSGANIKTVNGVSLPGAGNLSTFGVPLSQLTTDYGVRKVRAALRQMRAADILPAPAPIAAYQHTGTAVYCDPSVAGPGTGTLADPFKSIVTALAAITAAGQGLYILSGSTVNTTAPISVTVNGSASAPVVLGVYYAGGRRTSSVRGAATIDCGGNAIDAFAVTGRFVCIDGFKIQNNGNANHGVIFSGGATSGQVMNCDIVGGATAIRANTSGAGFVIQNNRSVGSANGIFIDPTTVNDSTTVVQYNTVIGATSRALMVYNGYVNTVKFSGTIAYNIVTDSTSVASDASGISIVTAGGSPKIYGNYVSKCNVGISIVSAIDFVAKPADYSGLLIQNNDLRNCEFGIATNGVIGTWLMEHNYIADSGTWNGTTKITTAGYGRGIELWGFTNVTATGGGTLRFNFITRSRNWATGTDTNGGEGVGIGLDDNTFGVTVYGNFLVRNEGNGIQLNTANGNKVISNICYDNCTLPDGSPRVIINGLAAEIVFALSFDSLIANNTLVSTGRTYQRNGISTWIYDGPRSRVHNNLCIGQTVSGASLTSGITESHNRVIGPPSLVVTETETARAAGTGTASTTSAAAIVPDDLFFSILPGGSCDGTGLDFGDALVDFDGQLSGGAKNIGATLLLSETR